jgi:MFS family permease
MLVASRLVQGAGAALLVPTSLALISQTYKGEARGRAIGTWAAAGGILMALGPPLGGWLIDTSGWRSIFFINVPLGGLAIILSTFIDVRGKRRDAGSLDVTGAVLAVLGLAAVTYGLIAIGEARLERGIAIAFLAIPLTVAFLWNERRNAHPMMPLTLFADRTFAGANALTVVLYGGLGAAIFLLPYSMIKLHHYTASEAGLGFLPLSIILGFGSRVAGSFAARVGQRLPLILGPVIAGVGFAGLASMAEAEHYVQAFLPGLVLVGAGMTLAIPALTSAIFDSVPDDQNGAASGINNAAARMGGLFATAALGIAFGSDGAGELSPETLTQAYVVVMFASAAAAVTSAIIAALTIHKAFSPLSTSRG